MRKFLGRSLISVVIALFSLGTAVIACPLGDLDGNCKVGLGDLQVFAQQWLDDDGCSGPNCANLDGVGDVTMSDFARLGQEWGKDLSGLVISEFMAVNNETLPDEEGKFRDWIEIYNPMDTAVDLEGWYLTDDADEDPNLTQWQFPAGVELLKSGEFLVVFASGNDRRDPGNPLHTNFKLGEEEDVALVTPDGKTIAHGYLEYPRQVGDVSYGLMQYARTLVAVGSTVCYHVPTIDDAGADWTAVDFPDSPWPTGPSGVSFGFGGVERVSYNDCIFEGDQHKGGNVTTYGIGSGFGGETSGPLLDQVTGEPTGVTASFEESGGVNWQSEASNGGSDCAAGTDAYNTFAAFADMTGVVYYGSSSGWWVDLTFTGLDPGTEYTFATSAARNRYSNPDRWARYTIGGADTFTNASSTWPGSGVYEIPGSGGQSVRFNTGDNHDDGYVARWTGIRASDGTFKVRVEPDPDNPSGHKAYAFDVFMLKGGFSGTNVAEDMEGVNASLWTRSEFYLEAGERDIFEKLTLRMKYEDGFVAYLNSEKVAWRNDPTTLEWNSMARSDRPIEEAAVFESINLTAYVGLLRDGKNVLAIHGLNDDKDDGEFLVLPELVAASAAGVPQYFTDATPWTFNVAGAQGLVSDVWFSQDRGFYENSFDLTLSTEMSSAEIRYTPDGSRPTINHGRIYSGPIPINKTSTIRAVAVRSGYLDSKVETHTYIFVNDVIHQSPNGAKPDPNWPSDGLRGQEFEYGMDSWIVNSSSWRNQVDDALLSIPTMSIVTDLDNLFYNSGSSATGGIYVNAGGHGRAWERPTSLEVIYPPNPQGEGFPDLVQVPDEGRGYRWELPRDMQGGFQINCGLRIRGGYSRSGGNPKHAFRFFFRDEYGDGELNYPLFGSEGAERFDKVDLRTSQNYSWSFANDSANAMCREVWARDSQGLSGQPYTRSRYYHLYINGHYWGLYQTQERSEAAYAETYFGGDRSEYDTVKAVGHGNYDIEATDGTLDAWRDLWDLANLGFGNHAIYNQAQGLNPDGTRNPDYPVLLDIDNLIDYMIQVFYDGDRDAPISNFLGNDKPNNWYGIRSRLGDEGFRYFVHDPEHIMSRGLTSRVGPYPAGDQFQYSNPQWIHQELMAHPDYCLRFADHAQKHLFGSGLLTPANAIERFRWRANQIDMAIIAESARWGSSSRTKSTWQSAVNNEINNFFPNRSTTIISQLKTTRLRDGSLAPLYPSINAPSFSHPGGPVPKNYPLTVTGGGTIYYTLDGSDPRMGISESLSSNKVALVREDAAKRVHIPTAPVALPTGSILYEYWRGLAGGSVVNLTSQPDFPDNPDGGGLLTDFEAPSNWDNSYGARIVGYVHPPASGDYTFWVATNDFGELWLSTDESPSNKVKIADVPGYAAPLQWDKYSAQQSAPKTLIGGRKYYIEALMKENIGDDSMAVTWSGPGVSKGNPIAGAYLSPATAKWYTSYYDDSSWTSRPSGNSGVGYERNPSDPVNYVDLIDVDVEADMYGSNATCYIRIPFTVSSTDLIDMTLRIKYDDGFVAYLNGTEVARRNFTGSAVWSSSATSEQLDDSAVVFEEIDISSHISVLRAGANLLAIQGLNRSAGDSDMLISVELTANEVGGGKVSPDAIRWYGGSILLDHSKTVKARVFNGTLWSALQEATFGVGPVAESLRITEIMYHPQSTGDPDDPNEEYIELKNISGQPINLNLVRFTNGIDFTFGDIELPAGEPVVVVKNRAAFDAQYPAFSGVVAGEYAGSLENRGERIELQDAIGQTILNFNYGDDWRPITDGQGFSLTIINPSNPDTSSWGQKDSWRASAYVGGSAGADDSGILPNPGDIAINEVLAHSHAEAADWIELYNTTGAEIEIGGWYLSDSRSDLKKYRIADGEKIGAYDYLVLREDVNFGEFSPPPADPGRVTGFALSENGDEVYLSSAESGILMGYREAEDFGASPTGVSFGRYFKTSTGNYNFVLMDHETPGWANAYPKVGPIVISEIMYNPISADQRQEYIELHNFGSTAVTLYDSNEGEPWMFTDGIEYVFPDYPGLTISAGGYVLIAKDIPAYINEYGVPPSGVMLLASYGGRLSNAGEKLELSMPGDVDVYGERYYIRVDRVNYSDGSHPGDAPEDVDLWPTEPDGGGGSLSRDVMSNYGNDPNNWIAASPSPGGP